MNWGQRLNMIEAALDSLHLAISSELIELTAKGRTLLPTDTGYAEFWLRIGRFVPRIEMALNQIKSMDHAIEQRRLSAWKVPREQRYPVKQSIRDQDRRLRQVHAKAQRIKEALDFLQFRGMSPTRADLLGGMQRLTKNVDSFVGKLEGQAPLTGVASVSSLVLIAALIVAALRKGPKKD